MNATSDLDALRGLEPAAVEQFYRDHAPSVLGWVIRLGGARLDSEDVAHQVFEVALQRLPSFRGESSPRTWLYGITRRVVANARRKQAIWSFVGLETWLGVDPGPDPEMVSGRESQRRRVQEALDTLPFGHREVVVLLDIEERPAAEVAQMLDVPVGTVYSRSHHARKAFASALKRKGVTAEAVLSWGGVA
ncbi:MAG: RNA polymerase sigma factor [Myxococcales bacterium]|nr:RNA polymerase sigma factor [Myxococcales bacterium]